MTSASACAGGIEIRNLTKIFGIKPLSYVDLVIQGMPKADLLRKYGHVLGLRSISLSIKPGTIQVIMGLSGSGKSTLVRVLNRLIEPTAGEVEIDGIDVTSLSERELREFRRTKTAMVFQKFALLPNRTVLGNVLFGLEVKGHPDAKDYAMHWIETVGLKGCETQFPSHLSGGMQQRVGLARALAIDAPILLMDEAFSALDPLIRLEMQGVLLELQLKVKKTIVFITHDLDEALRLGDSVAILRNGEIVQQGSAQDIVMHPRDDYIAAFTRDINRGRVLHVESIVERSNLSFDADALLIPRDASLETAARLMVGAGKTIAHVVDEQGSPIGLIDMQSLLAGIVAPRN